MSLELLDQLLTFTAAIAWPATVVALVLLLKGRISEIFIKHKESELRLGLVQIQQSAVADLSQMERSLEADTSSPELLEEIRAIKVRALSGLEEQARRLSDIAVEAESSTNANGRYRWFNNGHKTACIEIAPGSVTGKQNINFPIAFSTPDLNVTFVGEEVPALLHLTAQGATVSLQQPNGKSIKMIVTGM